MQYMYFYTRYKPKNRIGDGTTGQRVKSGVFVSIADSRGYFSVGWSQCNREEGDVWDAKRAIDDALDRARRVRGKFKSPEDYLNSVPVHLRRRMSQFMVNATKHYKCSFITEMPDEKGKQCY